MLPPVGQGFDFLLDAQRFLRQALVKWGLCLVDRVRDILAVLTGAGGSMQHSLSPMDAEGGAVKM
jgi:hypothetical protein